MSGGVRQQRKFSDLEFSLRKRIIDLEFALSDCRSWANCAPGYYALKISKVVDKVLGPLEEP